MENNAISVLIVEDEFLTSDFIKDVLEDIGYRISGIARDTAEAEIILKKGTTDIALLDINIHGTQTGIDLAGKINETYKIPFIYLTAFTDKKTIDLALKTGPSAYLVKPFNTIDIYTSIEVGLRNYTQQKTAEINVEPSPVENEHEEETLIGEDFLFIKQKEIFIKILIEDILYFHSDMKYIDIYTSNSRFTIRYTLSDIVAKFRQHFFMQIHRSYIVNINKVNQVGPNYIIMNEQKLPLGPSFKKEFLNRFKFLK